MATLQQTTSEQKAETPAIQHSPGPWIVGGMKSLPEASLAVWQVQEAANGRGRAICSVSPLGAVDEIDEANAHLIAAAPDLLAACKQMQRSLAGSPNDFAGMLAAHRAIDAAVAKAEGRS